MLAPFGAVIDALSLGKLERIEEVLKTIRTSLAQAKFGGGGGQRLGPEDYMRLFDPGFVQLIGVDGAKAKQAWDTTPERASIDLRDAINRAPKLPADVKGKRVLLLDPLLATGDTALAALDRLKQYEVGPIKLITILSAEVGLKKVQKDHPDVEIYTLSIERALNDKGYLLPGVGDAGDRLFRTM
jgi:phosphoribosylpyrophosphate synthetase